MLLILLLAYITGFGGLTSADHDQYVSIYKSYTSFSDISISIFSLLGKDAAYEIGYMTLMILCNIIDLGEAGFFFVVALIVNGSIIYYVYKHRLPVLALWAVFVSGFIALQTNLIRQSLALAIIFFFIDSLSNGKYIKYIIGVILASLFHTSALLFILFIPICFIKTERGQIILNFVLIGIVFFSVLVALGLIKFDVLSLLNNMETYGRYMSTENDVGTSRKIAHSIIFTTVAVFICLLFGKQDKQAATMLCVAAFISNIAIVYPNLARLKCYFITLGYISLIQYFDIKQYSKKQEVTLMSSIGLVFSLYFISVILKSFVFTETPQIFQETYSLDQFFK